MTPSGFTPGFFARAPSTSVRIFRLCPLEIDDPARASWAAGTGTRRTWGRRRMSGPGSRTRSHATPRPSGPAVRLRAIHHVRRRRTK
jgi:hypothetical protein